MALDPELVKILVCPECKTSVELLEGEKGLRCGPCGVVYPVRDGIPVMLSSEAAREN